MNIHYFSAEEWEKDLVRRTLPGDSITFHDGPFSAFADAVPDADVISLFMESKVGPAEMDRFPSLKLIATRSTGFDHIDLAAAKERGITVVNVPHYGENTVAEFTIALLLALSRRVIDADESVRAGSFSAKDLRGFDLEGKTLGVVGCGHIGMHVVRIAQGFGMKVLGFDMIPDPDRAAANHFTYVPLDELLKQSDIVTLHVPYNPHTHHLINHDMVGKMKRGAYLVNTSRGAVIETSALVSALKEGIIAGAALDVLEEEGDLSDETVLLSNPHPKEDELRVTLANHYLIEHPRVIVTPHAAFNTLEAVTRIVTTTLDSIKHFEEGAPVNIVALP